MLKMSFLDRHGDPIIKKKYRECTLFSNDQTYRVNMYFTLNYAGPCHCKFCRNKELSKTGKEHNLEEQIKQLKRWSRYVDTITIGGGEPLLQVDTINYLRRIDCLQCNNLSIVTSGIRKQFMDEVKKTQYSSEESLFNNLSTFFLSRLKLSDEDNQAMFNTFTPILTSKDIAKLPSEIRDKITILTTCCKTGVSDLEEMMGFVAWIKSIGVKSIIFNDLQKEVSGQSWQDNISERIFFSCRDELKKQGFEPKTYICYSGGYDIVSCTDGTFTIGFKHYHTNINETNRVWKKEVRKRTFDLALLPNGGFLTRSYVI